MENKTYPAAANFMLSSRYDLRCVEFVVDFMGSKLSKKIYDDSIHEVWGSCDRTAVFLMS